MKIAAVFEVADPEQFQRDLTYAFEQNHNVKTFTAGKDTDGERPVLRQFASAMEAKLAKNEHKTGWRELPVLALFRQMMLEIEEFKLALEFLTVREARGELVDVSNFCLILWDRLSMEPETAKPGVTTK